MTPHRALIPSYLRSPVASISDLSRPYLILDVWLFQHKGEAKVKVDGGEMITLGEGSCVTVGRGVAFSVERGEGSVGLEVRNDPKGNKQ